MHRHANHLITILNVLVIKTAWNFAILSFPFPLILYRLSSWILFQEYRCCNSILIVSISAWGGISTIWWYFLSGSWLIISILQNSMNAIVDLKNSQVRIKIFSVIQTKQNGKCHHCKKNIMLSDTVVSNGNGRGYYHKSCAEKLHIL